MAKISANSLYNSLKGKIWVATTVLAFFICLFGFISYLLVLYVFSTNTLYAVFVPFIFAAVSVIVFGWWLSDEVTEPIEKVSLLAKSLERGVSAAMPKTSGSTETDELLFSLQGISSQLQKAIASMEELSNGNLDSAFSAGQGSDRASQSFQKLLSKVAESVHAKSDLDKLRHAVKKLSAEVSQVRSGNLELKLETDSLATEEIVIAYKYLLENLNEIVTRVNVCSSETDTSAISVRNNLQKIIQQDSNRIEELSQASETLKKLPAIVKKISEELSQSSQTATQSIEKARTGNIAAVQNISSANSLRKKIQDTANRVERMNERSKEIAKVSKYVEDLAQRTSLVALNASIQAAELGESGKGFLVISTEIEQLAERAENTNRQISEINQGFRNEMKDISDLLEESAGETANLSKFASETGNVLNELEHYVAGFINLQNKIVSYSNTQSEETEKAFQVFVNEINETEKNDGYLKISEEKLAEISETAKYLKKITSYFKVKRTDTTAQTPVLLDFGKMVDEVAVTVVETPES